MPLVSILVPVYQTEAYLEQCLNSLIHQTLQDIEIICVNDGSTDGSGRILRRYEALDHRVRVINKSNGGLPSARNAGLDAARGEYVGFVDSDDYAAPEMFATLYHAACRDNSDIVVCGAHIFPVPPQPEPWLEQVLSPKDDFYPQFEPEVLFGNTGARPFIWRVLVKRELIEKNHLRLQEDIHIGEDNAFQFRLYPLAKGITLLSDKLYYYRWYREGSMMNQMYTGGGERVKSHVRLVEHIGEKWQEAGWMDSMSMEFLQWSVEFLYDDFIRLPMEEKVPLARKLMSLWEHSGYYESRNALPEYQQEMFKYFGFMAFGEEVEPKLSLILPVTGNPPLLERCLSSICSQSMETWELLCINNGAEGAAYGVLHRFLHKERRLRLFNGPKTSLPQALNLGITAAVGETILFLDTSSWLEGDTVLEEWLRFMKEKEAQVCGAPGDRRESSINRPTVWDGGARWALDGRFQDVLYQRELLERESLRFGEYSIFSGKEFLARCCHLAKTTAFFPKPCCAVQKTFHPDWLPTEKCVEALQGILKLIQLSVEVQDQELHRWAASFLYGDDTATMFLNNTLPYWMPEETCPDGENSQIETWSLLLQIASLIQPQWLEEPNHTVYSLPGLLRRFVDARHHYLAEISNRYEGRSQ